MDYRSDTPSWAICSTVGLCLAGRKTCTILSPTKHYPFSHQKPILEKKITGCTHHFMVQEHLAIQYLKCKILLLLLNKVTARHRQAISRVITGWMSVYGVLCVVKCIKTKQRKKRLRALLQAQVRESHIPKGSPYISSGSPTQKDQFKSGRGRHT